MGRTSNRKRSPILEPQIRAAGRIHSSTIWATLDRALTELGKRFPAHDRIEDLILKVSAIDYHYSTNLRMVGGAAAYAEQILQSNWLSQSLDEVALVDRAPRAKRPHARTTANLLSFASKYCHFYVNADVFPIYDSKAVYALNYHLGRARTSYFSSYVEFWTCLKQFRDESGLTCSWKELDEYLWVRGRLISEGPNAREGITRSFFASGDAPPAFQSDLNEVEGEHLAVEL